MQDRKGEWASEERWRVEEGISRLICLFPLLHVLESEVALPLSIAEFLFFAPSTNTYIFRLSPLWMCVHGVVLTKKDLVQAPFKAGLCDVAAQSQ